MTKATLDIAKNIAFRLCVVLISAGASYYCADIISSRRVAKAGAAKDESSVMSFGEGRVEMIISPYDAVFQEVCYLYDNDWRLMSAIAYHESRFKADVQSSQGARGLMQIMPSTAKIFDVDVDHLFDVEINIVVANLLMNQIENTMKFPDATPYRDRTALTLACYNGGISYIRSAQRLAKREDANPFSWSVIAPILSGMSNIKFATQKSVRHFRGASQTLAYVENVMTHYDYYCEIAEE